MLERKYLQSYKMVFLVFQFPLEQLRAFLKSHFDIFVWVFFVNFKVVKIVLYWLVNGVFVKGMLDL